MSSVMSCAPRTRLFIDQPLSPGLGVDLSRDQAHYLTSVLRLGAGAAITVFDSRTGAYMAQLAETGKRTARLEIGAQTSPLRMPPDVWLVFAPIKKARTDFIVEKAAEMGAARIVPVQTDFTNAERVRRDRLQAHVVEAAEQCGGTFVPPVDDLRPLSRLLDDWPAERRLMFCDEALAGPASDLPAEAGPWAILIGPEGGFSPAERARLRDHPAAHPVSLGPRILRADTAAVAALALWQAALGDWRA